MGIFIKNESQIALMRTASQICARTHELLAKYVKPGITTEELSKIAEEFIRGQDAKPTFLGYRGFPGAICTSINDHVIHGIPGLTRLKNGDIISIDIGVSYKRFHGDAARTHPVGMITPEHQRLIDVARDCFFESMRYARQGCYLHEISTSIDDYVTNQGFSVVQEWCGHGIGRQLHEDPQIPNTRQENRGPRLVKGMTLAIEPMINVGSHELNILDDTWTVVTRDGKYSAHYENTILITTADPEILTL